MAADGPREANGEGFEQLVRVHARAMYKVAVAIVRDSALAEDVVQEAVVRAWENLHTFRGDGPVRGWMLRITHNVAVSELRRSREQAWDPEKLSAVAVAAACGCPEFGRGR